MSVDLLLTLGHNSSAIAIDNGEIVNGYEEERFTKIKADSSFPSNAINAIGLTGYDTIYVSHWDPLCDLNNMSMKHWRMSDLPIHNKLVSLTRDFTHHDAHAFSALAFCDQDIVMGPDTWTIVADGFGNFGEVISIYRMNIRGYPKLVKRLRGYKKSLGLMYQYATANVGMKMNQDEYKFLGYETQISDRDYERKVLPIVDEQVARFIKLFNGDDELYQLDDPLYKLEALLETQLYWDDVLRPLDRDKVLVASTVQAILEDCVSYIIQKYSMNNVILCGGVFLNVKANLIAMDNIPGQISVMPLSGDQGAALGLYKKYNPDWNMPKHLFWGDRYLPYIYDDTLRLICVKTENEMALELHQLLKMDFIVNVVRGKMEFGPRALGHTSTIAQPTLENVEYINRANGRNTIMPMAPMINKYRARYWLKGYNRVINSLEYMVMVVPYERTDKSMRGASHVLPLRDTEFTGRPQLIDKTDRVMWPSIDTFSILLNTSFNVHGKPIVNDMNDVIEHFEYQKKNDPEERIVTLVLGEEI